MARVRDGRSLRRQLLAVISGYRRYAKHARKVAVSARLVDRRIAAKARAEAYDGVVLNLESLAGVSRGKRRRQVVAGDAG